MHLKVKEIDCIKVTQLDSSRYYKTQINLALISTLSSKKLHQLSDYWHQAEKSQQKQTQIQL